MKILFGVFDWGLGHATRDLPLIEELLKRGHKVDIISTGRALKLLHSRFGKKCNYFDVPSISVPYPKHRFFALKFVGIGPKMLVDIKRATTISKKIISEGKYDKVISDCRYDVYDNVANSYLINHQVRFKAPRIAESALEKWLSLRMERYKFIIVPDFKENNLTAKLSHDMLFVNKSKMRYIGILSQLEKKKIEEDIDFFISISGPEPQRTVLEEKILPLLPKLKGKIFVTLGKPETNNTSSNKRITICGFLNAKKQEEIMNRAKFIISRPGYTTVMEIAELEKKKVLFIPTPGQTEQEYLAEIYEEMGYFHFVKQHKIDLLKNIEETKNFNGYKPKWKTKESVKKFMKVIS